MFLSHLLFKRYRQCHRRSCMAMVFCISLFTAALLTTLWYRDMASATYEQEAWDQFGKDAGIVFNADPTLVSQGEEELHQSGGGAVYAKKELAPKGADKSYYVGYMDPQVMELRAIDLLEGRLPQAADEIAIEQSALLVLFPDAKVGDIVTLPLADAAKSAQPYRIVGILEPYQQAWRSLDGSKTMVRYPPPTLLTVPDSDPALYLHVFLADTRLQASFGGSFMETGLSENPAVSEGNNMVQAGVAALFLLFAFVMVFCLSGMARFAFKEIQDHLRLLRCVGMTKKQAEKLFAYCGVSLWLVTSVMGLVISLFLLGLIFFVVNAVGGHMVWSLSVVSPLLCLALSLLVLLPVLWLPVNKVFQVAVIDTGKEKERPIRKRKRKVTRIESVWHRATRRSYRGQNLTVSLISFLCVGIAVFGTATVMVMPRITYSSLLQGAYPAHEDYVMFVRNGASEGRNLYVNLPRNMGLTQDALDQLKQTQGLHVNSAKLGQTAVPYFVLDSHTEQAYLLSLRDSGQAMDPNEIAPPSESDNAISADMEEPVRRALAAAGCQDPSAMLVEPSIQIVDYDTVVQLLPAAVVESFTREDFLSGKIILAPETLAQKGDTFQMVLPMLESEQASLQFAANEVTVAATYEPTEKTNFLLFSAEYMLRVDPTARYMEVSIENTCKDDPERRKELEALLDQYAAAADNVGVINHIQEQEQYESTMQNGQLLLIGSLLLFLLILTAAISLSTSVKLHFNFQSYMKLRAIGAQDATLWRLIFSDTLVPLRNGCIVGLFLSLALSLIGLSQIDYVPVDDVYAVILGAAVGISLLLYGLSFLAIRRPVKNMLKKSVVEVIRHTHAA